MSRGMGHVRRRIAEVLDAGNGKMFSVDELCALVFPETVIGTTHRQSVWRALTSLRSKMDLYIIRAGCSGARGWGYRVCLKLS